MSGLPGNKTLRQGGRGVSPIAVPETIRAKAGGLVIDWSTVPTIGRNEIVTATITGSPTGGTFTLTFGGQTTSGIAFNATAATVEEALEALSSIGNGNIQVSGSAGGPYTIEFVEDLRSTNVGAVTASGAGLTGGSSPGVTIAVSQEGVAEADLTLADETVVLANDKYLRYGQVLTKITASGKYGPYDSGASDGRQTLTRGECYILAETILKSDPGSDGAGNVFDGGVVYEARLLIGSGTQPSKANFLAAFPDIAFADS